jgi:hypothetical protein
VTGMTAAFKMSVSPAVHVPLCLARLRELLHALQLEPDALDAMVGFGWVVRLAGWLGIWLALMV